jgi:Putative zinc-finger
MTCDDARESLSALFDEALAPDDRRAVETHLEGCAECRRELERLGQTVALLHRVTPAHAPAGFVDRVVAAAQPRPWYRRIADAVFLPLSAKLPVEATAIVMVALLAVYTFERTPALQEAARPGAPAARVAAPSPLADARKEAEPSPPAAVSPSPPGPRGVESRRDATTAREKAPLAESPPPAAPAVPPVAAPAQPSPPAPSREAPTARTRVLPPATGTPGAKAEAPAENVPGAPRPEADARRQSPEQVGGSTRAASGRAAKGAQPSADVVARVSVKDRDAAERDLAQLIAQIGGRQTQRRLEAEVTIVEAVIPQSRYAEFAQAVAAIGAWRVEAERPDLPSQVHVILRLE